jgi:hypothetical protein
MKLKFPARLKEVQQEIDSLFVTQTRFPYLGIEVNTEDLRVNAVKKLTTC